jgi:hypothetical protein
MEGGKEQNYWPGFVDALSNVVLTLVFVLVIFVFALLLASNKVSQKMQEVETAQKAQQQGQAELDKALAELQQLRSQEPASDNQKSDQSCLRFNKSDGSQKTQIDGTSLLILFGMNAISVTDDTTAIVHKFVDANRGTPTRPPHFVIETPEDPTSNSPLLARETQLGRMLNVRNALLSGAVNAGNISIHNIPPLQESGGYDWVRIHVEP